MASTIPRWSWLLLSAVFVLASSWLGLNGRENWSDLDASAQMFTDTWSMSVPADIVFVLGTVFAFAAAVHLAFTRAPALAMAASFALNWTVYAASFMLLPDMIGPDGVVEDRVEAVRFVLEWGIVGLAFAAVAPSVTVWALDRHGARRGAQAAS